MGGASEAGPTRRRLRRLGGCCGAAARSFVGRMQGGPPSTVKERTTALDRQPARPRRRAQLVAERAAAELTLSMADAISVKRLRTSGEKSMSLNLAAMLEWAAVTHREPHRAAPSPPSPPSTASP